MKKYVVGFAMFAHVCAWASFAPTKITCELVEARGNFFEYDVAAKKIDLVWHMVSHDGSTRIWREPLVNDTHASGYPYSFNNCQTLQKETSLFEYQCGSFTNGRLEIIGESGVFSSKTWINGGFTERKIPLRDCR